MFGHLPYGIISKVGYVGCMASLELAEQSVHPLDDAVVPSSEVSDGCQGKLLYFAIIFCLMIFSYT